MAPARDSGPMDRLKQEANGLFGALADRAVSTVRDRVESTADRLTGYVEGDGGPGLLAAVTGAKGLAEGKNPARAMVGAGWAGLKEKVAGAFGGKGKSGGRQKLKLTNIVESIEVGVPIRLAYNQWTSYRDFPAFTKKVENAEPDDENTKVNWKAQVFWSHREWEATIVDQRPDERIVWRSKGQKGHVDGVVTFHEITPTLTKIVVVLEYHPQGMFERTGNLWRAQGRRVRLELKHFQRHVMAHALLDPDKVEGWRGVIEDGEVVKDHETALEEEDLERDGRETDESDTEAAGTEADAEDTDADEDADAEEEDRDQEAGVGGRRRQAPARGGGKPRAPLRARQGTARGAAR
jgi:uncharacterized membrane protein